MNSGSYETGAIAPGQRISIYGRGLAQARVTVDGGAVQVLGASEQVVHAVAPEDLAAGRTAAIRVERADGREETVEVAVEAAHPAFFAADQYGKGVAAGRVVGGEVVLYATGLGRDLPVSVTVGGRAAEVLGIRQEHGCSELRVRIPEGLETDREVRLERVSLRARRA